MEQVFPQSTLSRRLASLHAPHGTLLEPPTPKLARTKVTFGQGLEDDTQAELKTAQRIELERKLEGRAWNLRSEPPKLLGGTLPEEIRVGTKAAALTRPICPREPTHEHGTSCSPPDQERQSTRAPPSKLQVTLAQPGPSTPRRQRPFEEMWHNPGCQSVLPSGSLPRDVELILLRTMSIA